MLETAPFTLLELLQERREGAVRAVVRIVGYALAHGGNAEQVGSGWFEAYRRSAEFKRLLPLRGRSAGAAFAVQHIFDRWGYCDDVHVRQSDGVLTVESESMLLNHDEVLGFHGVTRMDMEACIETLWRLLGAEIGLEVTYTIDSERDLMMIRTRDGSSLHHLPIATPEFTPESLAAHRRLSLASTIVASIGLARRRGSEPEDLGHFFYKVWEGSGHYDKLRDRNGFGNALAYAQSLTRSRQVLYPETRLMEDLDGYTVTSPSWNLEIPHVYEIFSVRPEDVYRYFAGGGTAACSRLGLQYADQSDQSIHRVWIRSR